MSIKHDSGNYEKDEILNVKNFKMKKLSRKSYHNRSSRSSSYVSSNRKLLHNNSKDEAEDLNLQYEKFFLKQMDFLNTQENITLCISGKAFYYILQQYKQELEIHNQLNENNFKTSINKITTVNSVSGFGSRKKINSSDIAQKRNIYINIINIIREKGKIFFRMSPNDKVALVNHLKEDKNNIVAMCGDGANDCGALLTADVGISVRSTKGNSVTAHFYSEEESISCIEVIIKNGRACIENCLIIYKFMTIYAFLEQCGGILLLTVKKDFTDNQYLFMDLIVLIVIMVACKTGPCHTLRKEVPPQTLIKAKFLISTFGNTLILVVNQIGFFYYLKTVVDLDEISDDVQKYPDVASSYLFIFTSIQIICVMISLNSNSKHRKRVSSNKLYIFVVSFLFSICICFVSVSAYFKTAFFGNILVNFEDEKAIVDDGNMELKRVITMSWSLLIFGFIYLFEYLVEFFSRKLKNKK